MIYIPVHKDQAENLAVAIYKLSVPNPPESNVTKRYCEVIAKEGSDMRLLALPETDVVPIHLQADPQIIVNCLTQFVEGGQITQAELDGIVGGIQALAGSNFNPANLVPPSWQPFILDHTQAVAEGYFNE